ncbi:helix-turn-helix domain-containing protein [Flavobacterium sp.]|uniref:helix-turn-helix domain-containing protein n=1 Tax=Flavobacterium sp. TaxID=239 RepID=UPI002621D987|nr:helix-turn-helix domain-containing protein [Flavobacterium sp.]
MAIEVLTKEDLYEFRHVLLKDIKEILQTKPSQTKEWLKSTEVRKLLNISPGTLQTLRINKTLSYTRIGGIIYYAHRDIEKLLEGNKVESERTLFNSK